MTAMCVGGRIENRDAVCPGPPRMDRPALMSIGSEIK